MSDEEKDPCEDAIDLLWQEIILKNRPDYGDWEYPGQAYRHIKDEHSDVVSQRDSARTRVAELEALVITAVDLLSSLHTDSINPGLHGYVPAKVIMQQINSFLLEAENIIVPTRPALWDPEYKEMIQ